MTKPSCRQCGLPADAVIHTGGHPERCHALEGAARERPVLFRAPMIRALLAGRKTQTRRAVKLREFGPSETRGYDWTFRDKRALWNDLRAGDLLARCPHGVPGDRLWAKETWQTSYMGATDMFPPSPKRPAQGSVVYRASWDGPEPRAWRPSLFMPRWASRLTLEVTEVRVERLQSISEEDARAEGVEPDADCLTNRCQRPHRDRYFDLWNEINGQGAWEANPYVWAISFKLVTP